MVDIGCGYGVDAHRVAERTGAHVSGLTISHAQAEKARYITPPIQGKVSIEQGDWLQNTYPAQSFDRAIAVESLSHMQDKKRFFFEMHRVLVPGGRAAVACWTIEPEPSAAERALLQLICQAGSLPSLGSMRDYQDLSHAAGLSLFHSRDLTALVEPSVRQDKGLWTEGRRDKSQSEQAATEYTVSRLPDLKNFAPGFP